MLLRTILTGKTASPPLLESLIVFGRPARWTASAASSTRKKPRRHEKVSRGVASFKPSCSRCLLRRRQCAGAAAWVVFSFSAAAMPAAPLGSLSFRLA